MTILEKLEDIQKIAKDVYKKYSTLNPFRICKSRGIQIHYAPLGSLNAYYTIQYRIPFITINDVLNEYEALIACTHELGHLFLGHTANKMYFSQRTRFKISPWETAANTFVVYFRLQALDEDAVLHMTKQQMATMAGIPESLIDLIR